MVKIIFHPIKNQGERIGCKMKTLTINNNNRVRSDRAGCIANGDVKTYAPTIQSASDGDSLAWTGHDRPDRTPERITKARLFFQRRIESRKDPHNCPRCGGPRGDKFKTCDKCRANVKHAKLRARGFAVKHGAASIDQLAAMVFQMRREMDKMQTRFKLWQRAAKYRQNLKYRTNAMRKKYLPPEMSKQELATMNHAYDNRA